MKIKSYKELIVWQKSIQLVVFVYQLTHRFPKEEKYGLSTQMRRAAVAVPSNIAEGFARRHLGEYIQFLYISIASLAELETQIIIAEKLNYPISDESRRCYELIIECGKMLNTIINNLKKNR